MIGAAVLVMGFWGAAALWRWGRRWPAQVLASLLALVWVLQGLVVNPLITDSSSGRGLMREVGRRLGPDVELGLVAWKEQNLLMADRPVANFGFLRPWPEQLRAGVAWQQSAPSHRWLLVQDEAVLACIDRGRSQHVGSLSGRGWWLVPSTAVRGPCRSEAERAAAQLAESSSR